MTEVQKLGLKDFIVLKIFDAVWMLLELTSPRFQDHCFFYVGRLEP